MTAYLIRRLWQMIPTLLGVVLLVYLLFNWIGGDPAYILAGKISNPEQIANIRKQLGLDEPTWVQIGIFLKQIVTFDFGNSWSTGEPVSNIIGTRLGPSLTLLIPLMILETVIAIAFALAVAYVRGSLTDRTVMIACTVGMSISILVYIIVFQYGLAYKLGLFPVQGWGDSLPENLFRYSTLPILILLAVSIAPNLRLFRTFVLDEVNQDYRAHRTRQGLERISHFQRACVAQRGDSDHHARDGQPADAADRRVSGRALLLDSRHRPRSNSGSRTQRFPGHQGDYRLRCLCDHVLQPADRRAVSGRRPACAIAVEEAHEHRPLPKLVDAGLASAASRPRRHDFAWHRRRFHGDAGVVFQWTDCRRLGRRSRRQLCATVFHRRAIRR